MVNVAKSAGKLALVPILAFLAAIVVATLPGCLEVCVNDAKKVDA